MLLKDITGKIKNKKMKKQENDTTNIKKCIKCNSKKHLNEFNKDKRKKDGKASWCKACWKFYYINNKTNYENHYLKNKDKILLYRKDYIIKNEDILIIKRKKYNQKIKEKTKNYHNNRWKNDENYKLIKLMRNRFIELIKKTSLIKSDSVNNLIGCSINECKKHLESLFYPEMNWSNHGEIWEIDHIIPCSSFNLTETEEQKKCFNFSNLQPLFKTTKIAKSFGYNNIMGNRNKSNKNED